MGLGVPENPALGHDVAPRSRCRRLWAFSGRRRHCRCFAGWRARAFPGERRLRVGAFAGTEERAGGGRDGAPRRWARCRVGPHLRRLGRGPGGVGGGGRAVGTVGRVEGAEGTGAGLAVGSGGRAGRGPCGVGRLGRGSAVWGV